MSPCTSPRTTYMLPSTESSQEDPSPKPFRSSHPTHPRMQYSGSSESILSYNKISPIASDTGTSSSDDDIEVQISPRYLISHRFSIYP